MDWSPLCSTNYKCMSDIALKVRTRNCESETTPRLLHSLVHFCSETLDPVIHAFTCKHGFILGKLLVLKIILKTMSHDLRILCILTYVTQYSVQTASPRIRH